MDTRAQYIVCYDANEIQYIGCAYLLNLFQVLIIQYAHTV